MNEHIYWLNFHINNSETLSLILTLNPAQALTLLAAVTNPSDYPFGTKLYEKRPHLLLFKDVFGVRL